MKKSGKEATSRKGATVRKYTLHSKKNQLLKTDQISIEYEGEVRYLTEFIDLMQKNIKDVNQMKKATIVQVN